MRAPRTLSIVGASEESAAHVRLLLRMAGMRLEHAWALQDGEEADLVILEPSDDVASRTLQARYQAAGIAFAILCDADAVVMHGMVLRRPIKLGQLVAVLNAAGKLRDNIPVVTGADSDFYNAELGDLIPDGRRAATWDRPEHAHGEVADDATPASTVDAFELLVHGDPLEEPLPSAPLITSDTRIEPHRHSATARSAMRHNETGTHDASLLGVTPMQVEPISLGDHSHLPPAQASTAGLDQGRPVLPALLAEGAILSPTRLSGEGLADLILDPKLRRYYSRAGLHELQPYVEAGSDRVQSARSVGSELQQARENQRAGSFDELRWLVALTTSRGRLDASLDPGGSYSVSHALDSAPDLRAHGRIVALMATPMHLHVLARVSGAQMEEVFDVVNAYHAIGRLDYVPRQSLQGYAKKDERNPLSRLFSRK